MRKMFTLFLQGEGERGPFGIKAMVVWLNERGYRTRRGGTWGVGQPHQMLTNPVYAGRLRFNRTEARSCKEKKGADIIYADVHAILDAAMFEQVSDFSRSGTRG